MIYSYTCVRAHFSNNPTKGVLGLRETINEPLESLYDSALVPSPLAWTPGATSGDPPHPPPATQVPMMTPEALNGAMMGLADLVGGSSVRLYVYIYNIVLLNVEYVYV
jgi:hypothetical protein